MSEEKIACPECGWSGAPSARCPNCGGALYRLSPGVSEAPVETLPGQPPGAMSVTGEMPESPVAGRSVPPGAMVPEDGSLEWARKSERWVERIRRPARELAEEVEDAGKEFRSRDDSIRKTLADKRERIQKWLEGTRYGWQEVLERKRLERDILLNRARDVRFSGLDLSVIDVQRWLRELERRARDLEEAVDAFHARAGILAQVPVNAFTTSQARITGLAQDLVNTRRNYLTKRAQASRMPEEREGTKWGMGCLTFLVMLIVFGTIVRSSETPFMIGLVLLIATFAVPVIVGRYFGSTLPRMQKWAVEAERDSLERQLNQIYETLEKETAEVLRIAEGEAATALRNAEEEANRALRSAETEAQKARQQMAAEIAGRLKEYLAGWKVKASELRQELGMWGEDWTGFTDWGPVSEPLAAVRLGELEMDIDLPLPGVPRETLSLPLLVPFTGGKGLSLEASEKGWLERIRQTWQSLAFRLLASVPPGKLRFTFIDPVGLGNNAAPMLHLKQYDESDDDSLVTSRAWSEPEHIRKQLAKIKEHISTVVQERLRDEYQDIAAYNRQAGEIAVPYRILFVFDFPTNFTDEAIRDIISIAETGARAGVFPIVMVDTSKQMPYGFTLGSLSARLPVGDWHPLAQMNLQSLKCRIRLDGPPDESTRKRIIEEWGKRAKEGMRVEVPFGRLLRMSGLDAEHWWKGSTREGFEVPLGPKTAREPQLLVFGKGTTHHGLIVGRTGSGKSNLMHVIISGAILKYPPEELALYLIDLKSVELVAYKDVPHVKVLAVDADREFALAVLREVNNEMLRRMEAFRGVADDFTEYRDKTDRHDKKLPRILLLIDEFQVLFEQDDQIGSESRLLLDRLARQGRAFGIHVLLGSQSLAGYSLSRTTIDQMAVRIALQCSEADSRLVLAEDNPAARRLSRPGQAIYNSANGLIEGNTEFQVALFGDEDRQNYVGQVISLAETRRIRQKPVLFAGNEPARIESCIPLIERLKGGPPSSLREANCWIGESVSVAPPVAVRMSRQTGTHLAVVTREEAEGVGVLMSCALSLCAQYPPGRLQLYIADFSTPGTEWAEMAKRLETLFSEKVKVISRKQLPALLERLSHLIRSAVDEEQPIAIDHYLFLVGLHRIRELRGSGDSLLGWGQSVEESPAGHLTHILREGPETGVHVLMWCDTVGNLQRSLDRRALQEIGFRVAGPMSEQDSVQFLEEPHAARIDKPHRMLYYDMDRPGELEKFRPYVVRDLAWLERLIGGR